MCVRATSWLRQSAKPHKTGLFCRPVCSSRPTGRTSRSHFNQRGGSSGDEKEMPPPIKICFHHICVAPLLVWLVAQVSPTADTLSRSLNNGLCTQQVRIVVAHTRSPFPSWREPMTSPVPPRGPHRKIWMRLVHVIQCAGWLIYFSVMSPAHPMAALIYTDNSFAERDMI